MSTTALSLHLTTALLESGEVSPDVITIGSSAPATTGVEVRITITDTATPKSSVRSNEQIIRALMAFVRFFEDGRLASVNTNLV